MRTAAVVGLGPVGLLVGQLLRIKGASRRASVFAECHQHVAGGIRSPLEACPTQWSYKAPPATCESGLQATAE